MESCLHSLFEQRAAEAPDSIALSFEGQTLAYGELNRRANRIAHRLIAEGVRPDTLVGLAAGRGLEVIVGLLAILKAGGVYVPLDPAYPEDRLAYLIEDSGLQLLLAEDSARERLAIPAQVRVLALETDDGHGRDDNPNVALSPANLAYVIYTSGSTGQPRARCSATPTPRVCSPPPTPGSALVRRMCGACSTPSPSTSRYGKSSVRCSMAAAW